MAAELFVGLMSGTSLDGVDAVLASFDTNSGRLALCGHSHLPFPAPLRESLLAFNQRGGPDELHRSALAANAVSSIYAEAVKTLLQSTATEPNAVAALGAHGQTVRHRPGEFDATGYTIQLLNGARLAELTGIDVICDFRSRDVAAGGQGAPLVPAFHQAIFGEPGEALAVLNIGGIANLTLLDEDGNICGFDTGPGNGLLDGWCQRHLGNAFDEGGRWSAGGQVDQPLLDRLLKEPYFAAVPPKSTGRDLFNADWLGKHLAETHGTAASATQDVQATLCQLTARTIAEALDHHLPQARQMLVCGGGALNSDLLQRLSLLLPRLTINLTDSHSIPCMQVEAAAFAWLARQYRNSQPGNCVLVTGAAGSRILGCRYPA